MASRPLSGATAQPSARARAIPSVWPLRDAELPARPPFLWTCSPAPFSSGSSLLSGFSASFENVLGFFEGPQQTHATLALAFLGCTLSPVLVQELRIYDPAALDTARTWMSHVNLNLNMPQSRLIAFPSKWASPSTPSLKSEPGSTPHVSPHITNQLSNLGKQNNN